MRKALLVIPLGLAAVAALWWSQRQPGPYFVSGFIEADTIRLGSRIGGRVLEVHAVEGQRVGGGDVLVTLEPYDLREQLAETKAKRAAADAALEKLRAGYRPEEIAQARARRERFAAVLKKLETGQRPLEIQIKEDKLAEARAELAWAETDYERVKRLRENSQASKEELDQAIRRVETARARFAAARDELALAKEGTRSEEVAEARAGLAEAEAYVALLEQGYRSEEIAQAEAGAEAAAAAVASIERRLEELRVRAPIDGLVEAVDLEPGDLVAPNAPMLTLLDASHLWVRAYVPENRLNLAPGEKVALRVDAFPQRRFAGHVSFVSRQAEFTPSNVQTPEERVKQMFRIKVEIDEGLEVLRAGMLADVFLEPAK